MKLLLFDIDGTLLRVNGRGREVIEDALAQRFGKAFTTHGVGFSGRTDPQIFRDVLLLNGFTDEEATSLLPDALDAYAGLLPGVLRPAHVALLPGVQALLVHLHRRNDVQLGLVTGNLEPTAYLKLHLAGLADFFPLGAYGSDHADRNRLPEVALARARQFTGRRLDGQDVVIIGDTEHDIACGRGLGAFSVGVCTGHYARADLAACAPDLLLDDLTDVAGFLSAVLDRP